MQGHVYMPGMDPRKRPWWQIALPEWREPLWHPRTTWEYQYFGTSLRDKWTQLANV